MEKLRLTNFRNFENFEWQFTQPVTLVLGPNGSGKSNLLEAIYFLATGSSSRTHKDQQVIRWDQKVSRVEGVVGGSEIAVVIQKSGKRLFVNGKEKLLRDFLPRLYAVLFQPSDLNLLSGAPRQRRRFLDQLLGAYDYEYLHALIRYRKALRQRNWLLSDESYSGDELAIWTDQLIEYGEVLQEKRASIVDRLNKLLDLVDLSVKYLKSPRNGELGEKLSQLSKKEEAVGFTLVGPQRDDLTVGARYLTSDVRHSDLGIYGSRGQQRMAITHLKLAQLQIIEAEVDQKPILLLDDIFSELDREHQNKVVDILRNQQTIVTSAHLEDPVVQSLQESGVDVVRLIDA